MGWKVIYFPNVLSVWTYLRQSNFCIFTSAASILHYPHYSYHHTQISKKKLNIFENRLYSCHLSVSPATCETAVKAIIFLFLAQLYVGNYIFHFQVDDYIRVSQGFSKSQLCFFFYLLCNNNRKKKKMLRVKKCAASFTKPIKVKNKNKNKNAYLYGILLFSALM